MRRFPKAKVRLEYLRPKVYAAVANGEVDLGNRLLSNGLGRSWTSSHYGLEPMVVVCPPGHELATHKSITAERLQGMDFVAFDRDLIIRKEIDRYFAAADR